jgi:hypothetical protein
VVVASLIKQYTKKKKKTVLVLFPNVATETYSHGAYKEECLINFIYRARKLLFDIGLMLMQQRDL